MEQDAQRREQNNPILLKRKNKSKKTILIFFAMILAGAFVSYFLFFSTKKDDDVKSEDQNMPASKEEKIEEPKIDKELDADRDGLPDYLEKIIGTDGNNSDTDGDGYADLTEIKNGYDPLTAKKYSDQEWGLIKGKIKMEDREYYDKTFETAPLLSQDPNAASETDPTPEGTLSKFITVYEANNIRDLLDVFNKATIYKLSEEADKNGQLSYETMFSIGLFDIFYHQTKYGVIERTDVFAVMAPEKREVEEGKIKGLVINQGEKVADYEIKQRPDIYFEKEDGEWKINMNVSILDMNLRKLYVGEKMREDEINNLKIEWKKSLE